MIESRFQQEQVQPRHFPLFRLSNVLLYSYFKGGRRASRGNLTRWNLHQIHSVYLCNTMIIYFEPILFLKHIQCTLSHKKPYRIFDYIPTIQTIIINWHISYILVNKRTELESYCNYKLNVEN